MNRYLISITFIIAILAAYLTGVQLGQRGFDIALYQTQGELAFNHLQRYESLKMDLEMNCGDIAIQKLNNSINEQKMLLSEIINAFNAVSVRDYILLRNRALLDELDSYEGNWDVIITEDECD